MPPIGTDKFSRVIFHDLVPELNRLRTIDGKTGTAFLPESVRVLRTERYDFLDEPYVEAIHFTKLSCPYLDPNDPATEFTTNNVSNSEVNFFVDADHPECALPTPGKGTTFLQLNENCGTSVVAGEVVAGLEFEPKCMVVVIEPSSRLDLFQQFVRTGRVLTEKLRVEVNFTLGLGANPSVPLIKTNCLNSQVLSENYELDRTLQDELEELRVTRENITRTTELIQFIEYLLDNRPASALLQEIEEYRTRAISPPPSPPGTVESPPSPPSVPEALRVLNRDLVNYQRREEQLVELVSVCESTRTHPCGLPAVEAPNPWVGQDGRYCRGYYTKSTRLGDFCGYWLAEANVDGQEAGAKAALLQAGPWCFAAEDGDEVVECSGAAQRTQRAGVHEIEYWLREDRRFCESAFFRSRVTPDVGTENATNRELPLAEQCRLEIAERNTTCFVGCDTCDSHCTSATVRGLTSVAQCSVLLPTLGTNVASQVTDAGQNIVQRHGAKRAEGRAAIPADAWDEQWRLLVNNDVESPRVPRNGVSCRKPHRESTFGHYTPSLNDKGEPILRSGFMVGCDTDSDCYSRCGEHPITGNPYVCTKNPRFYSFFVINRGYVFENDGGDSGGNAAATTFSKRFQNVVSKTTDALNFSVSKTFSFLNQPGDDKFDAGSEHRGVCTDTRYDFAHTGCTSSAGAAATLGLVGCTAKLGWARSYCGALTERSGPDFLDVAISDQSLSYPRVLVPGSEVNGVVVPDVTCEDATACVNKCELYNRRARSGGLPAPEACALCEPICPNNFATSAVDTIDALWSDVNTAFKLARICLGELGMSACVCNLFLLLKPVWIDRLPTPQMQCQGGNIFGLLVTKIVRLIARLIDDSVNGFIVDPINFFLDNLPWPLDNIGKPVPRLCLTGFFRTPRGKCDDGPINDEDRYGCLDGEGFSSRRTCYFARQRAICLSNDDKYDKYNELFEAPNAEQLNAQYRSIVGESYDFLESAVSDLMDSVADQVKPADVAEAQDLCDASLFNSMDLDEIILTCIFKFIENFCPSADSSKKFDTFLKTELVWKLPTVTFDWTASPPPPPPAELHSSIAQLALLDPEGWARAEQALDDFFPRLSYVLSKKAGSILNSQYGIFGPKYYVNKYEATVAFLATQAFENQDSLSARMVQARFNNYGRFSCKAMLNFMSDPSNAAAGSNAPERARASNPADFNSPYDRNWLLMFASIFVEDLQKQTGVVDLTVNALSFWTEQCEEPASYRTPTDTRLWTTDPDRLGIKDAQGNSVEARDILPLLAYGSLRQLRDYYAPTSSEYTEDPSLFVVQRLTRRRSGVFGRRLEDEAEPTTETDARPRDRRRLLITFLASKILKGALGHAVKGAFTSEDETGGSIGIDFNAPASSVHFLDDRNAMATNIVYERLSSVVCSPEHSLTIEEVMGDPPPFDTTDALVDSSSITTPKDLRAPARLRGNGNFDKKYSQSSDSVRQSGDLTYRERSLQAFVYITSSDDPEVLPGWHRLADLRAFPDRDCDELPNQVCGAARAAGQSSSTAWTLISQMLVRFSILFGLPLYQFQNFGTGRRLSSVTVFKINQQQTDRSALRGYRSGTEALLRARCSTFLANRGVSGAQRCAEHVTAWFRDSAYSTGCSDENLELAAVADFRSLEDYLDRFVSPSPPPLPPPSTPPPDPPSPPMPSPPPSPPRFESRDAALAFARTTMENFCDSVYIMSSEARCNALAIEMHTRFQLSDFTWNPPALPPLLPTFEPPPPPPSPPSPSPPREESAKLQVVPIYRARLSTYFVPTIAPSPPPIVGRRIQGDVDRPSEWGARVGSGAHAEMQARLAAAGNDTSVLAACTESLRDLGAPLPCRNGINPLRCLDGERHCKDAYDNALEPFVELDFQDFSAGRKYLFAVHFKIPPQEEYGRLLFHPDPFYGGDVQANRGWRLTAFDESRVELPKQCQDWNYGANAVEHVEGLRDVTHACLSPLAVDADYEVMSRARFLRITLIGQWRQLWVDELRVVFRSLPQSAPLPPPRPPSHLPRPPLGPEQPPLEQANDSPFEFYENLAFVAWDERALVHLPCALSARECARAARAVDGATAFALSASGCCHALAIDVDKAGTPSEPYQFGVSGTGVFEN